MDDPANDNPDERYARNLPSLLIPYWEAGALSPGEPGDRGDVRPLPASIVPYLCDGITTASPYQPDQPLTVTVAVRNWGGGSASSLVTVRLWWEMPGTVFAQMNPSRLMGVSLVQVPPRGTTFYTPPITYAFTTIPPPHIRLIACVDHPLDQAPRASSPPHAMTPLPGVERHWAQHNLSYVQPSDDGVVDFSFVAANPFLRQAEFVFEVRSVDRRRAEHLRKRLRTDVITVEAHHQISAARDIRNLLSPVEARHPYSTTIEAGRQVSMHLRMQLGQRLERDEVSAFELVQRRTGEDRVLGGITIVIVDRGKYR